MNNLYYLETEVRPSHLANDLNDVNPERQPFIAEHIQAQVQPQVRIDSAQPSLEQIAEEVTNASIELAESAKKTDRQLSMFGTQNPSKILAYGLQLAKAEWKAITTDTLLIDILDREPSKLDVQASKMMKLEKSLFELPDLMSGKVMGNYRKLALWNSLWKRLPFLPNAKKILMVTRKLESTHKSLYRWYQTMVEQSYHPTMTELYVKIISETTPPLQIELLEQRIRKWEVSSIAFKKSATIVDIVRDFETYFAETYLTLNTYNKVQKMVGGDEITHHFDEMVCKHFRRTVSK